MCKEISGAAASGVVPWNNVAAVTNRHLTARPYLEQIERICSFHPAAVIVREKDLPEEEYAGLAGKVLQICRQYKVSCIYHTYPMAALEAGARAVHLPLPLLRKYRESGILGQFSHVGTSVHSVQDAEEAAALGASYLTAGHIYATDCKKGAAPRGLSFLEEICRSSSVPVWGIGGICPDAGQIEEVLSCGAAGACIMSGMMRI